MVIIAMVLWLWSGGFDHGSYGQVVMVRCCAHGSYGQVAMIRWLWPSGYGQMVLVR